MTNVVKVGCQYCGQPNDLERNDCAFCGGPLPEVRPRQEPDAQGAEYLPNRVYYWSVPGEGRMFFRYGSKVVSYSYATLVAIPRAVVWRLIALALGQAPGRGLELREGSMRYVDDPEHGGLPWGS